MKEDLVRRREVRVRGAQNQPMVSWLDDGEFRDDQISSLHRGDRE